MLEKKKSFVNNLVTGTVVGLIVPAVVLYILYLINKISVDFLDYVVGLQENGILIKMISICVLPVLGVFYFFLQKKWYSSAKGTIISVFLLIMWALYANIF